MAGTHRRHLWIQLDWVAARGAVFTGRSEGMKKSNRIIQRAFGFESYRTLEIVQDWQPAKRPRPNHSHNGGDEFTLCGFVSNQGGSVLIRLETAT